MNNEEQAFHEAIIESTCKSLISRGQLFKAAGVGLMAAALPGVAGAQVSPGLGYGTGSSTYQFFPQITSGTYTTESILSILNVAATAETLAVTVLTAALNNAAKLGLSGLLLNVVQAALVSEMDHLQFLRAAGAQPLTSTFTVPDPKILTDLPTFLSTLEVAESIFVAAYMTATREFAELGQPTLAKYAYQIGGVEAEHRTLVRAGLALMGLDHTPPNNKGFETDLLLYVSDAVGILKQLGFVGGSGPSVSYPGDAAANAAAGSMMAGVIQNTPNNANSTVTVTGPGDLTGQRS